MISLDHDCLVAFGNCSVVPGGFHKWVSGLKFQVSGFKFEVGGLGLSLGLKLESLVGYSPIGNWKSAIVAVT